MPRPLWSVPITIAFIMIAALASASSLTDHEVEVVDALVMAGVDSTSPGLAVGIVRSGEVVYERYAGLAELDHRVPIDPRTRFNIASNAKQFTALCVLRLARDGALSLDDDLRDHLPDALPGITASISVAQLITHTSGLRDVYDLWALQGQTWWKQFVGNRQALTLLRQQTELNFAPGSDYLYSNSNYLLLAELVSAVTDRKFRDVAGDLFTDLGMPDTGFLTGYMTVVPHRARPYSDWGSWKQYPAVTTMHGDGNLFTTLRDQLAWEQAVQRGTSSVFDAEALAASQAPLSGQATDAYGFGIEIGEYRGFADRSHAGSTGAYGAYFIRLPERGLSVVVMSNSSRVSAGGVALGCVDVLLGDAGAESPTYPAGPVDVGPHSAPQSLEGDYLGADGTLIRIALRNGGLQREIYGRDPVRLIPEAGGLYHYQSNDDLKMAFHGRGDERRFTIYHPAQPPSEYVRLPLVSLDEAHHVGLSGNYRNAETGGTVEVARQEGDAYSVTIAGEQLDGRLMRPELLLAGGWQLRIERENDRPGELLIDGARLRAVRFLREPPAHSVPTITDDTAQRK